MFTLANNLPLCNKNFIKRARLAQGIMTY